MATETESGLQTHQSGDFTSDHAIQMTQAGDQTIYSSRFNEHYHSKYGAVQESAHIFIQAGYRACLSSPSFDDTTCRILEVGFGTGLNAFLTLLDVPDGHRVDYVGLEKYPLDSRIVEQLTYPSLFPEFSQSQVLFEQLHGCSWGKRFALSESFSLYKLEGDLCRLDTALEGLGPFHCIYFDAFSPETQPELWTLAVFQRLQPLLMAGGRLVTYCAKGVVKRTLAQAGFQVSTLPGPYGKREMVVAHKTEG